MLSMLDQVEEYFDKSFEFIGNDGWVLPDRAYETGPWQIKLLQDLKLYLNNVKGQLNQFDLAKWSEHTKNRDPASLIIPILKERGSIELLTQAWCKFYETLNHYPLIPQGAIKNRKLRSVHLCEAPGAFISALNRFLYVNHRQIEWEWLATTLNPYYEGNNESEMITDDRLIKQTTKNWFFGADGTGDLTKYYNHEALVRQGHSLLVTADGSINCMSNPGEQENTVHFLHYCETMTALKILNKHGTFVLKIFTIFEHATICLLYLLCCCFVKVRVFKPCSSKSGNSEVYVICLDYKGRNFLGNRMWELLIAPYRGGQVSTSTHAMFPLDRINPAFLRQVEECDQFFMYKQCVTITKNIEWFLSDLFDYKIVGLQAELSDQYVRRFPIAFHIPKRLKLMKNQKKHQKSGPEEDWEFKTVAGCDWELARDSVLAIKTGRAVRKVFTSRFCREKIVPTAVNEDALFQAVSPFLASNYTVVQWSAFDENLTQHDFQKEFFRTLKGIVFEVNCNSDVVLIGVPLLTRFLVGIVCVLGLGYESILVYKRGALVLHKIIRARKQIVQEYFTSIDVAYSNLESGENQFETDVLEIIPNDLLEKGDFYQVVRKYNEGIYKNGP